MSRRPNAGIPGRRTTSLHMGRVASCAGWLEGTATGLILRLGSTAFLNDPRMVATTRAITVEGDHMSYTQSMHTNAVAGAAQHVEARLKRVSRNGT